MKITKTLYAPNRKEWRDWLKKHYKTEKEIWLVYYRKAAGGVPKTAEALYSNDGAEQTVWLWDREVLLMGGGLTNGSSRRCSAALRSAAEPQR